MCIISVKKQGVNRPTKKELVNCNQKNSDGIGIAYYKQGMDRVQIKKDFTSFKDFYKFQRDNIDIDTVAIYHFRWATSGLVDFGNRHPFPVTQNKKMLRKANVKCRLAMAHNGVIQNHSGHKKYSDTQKFIYHIVSNNNIQKHIAEQHTIDLLESYIGNDKLAFLDNKGKLTLIGDYQKHNGLLYSNNGYKKEIVRYVSHSTYQGMYQNSQCEIDTPKWLEYDHCEYCDKWKKVDEYTVDGYSVMVCKKCFKEYQTYLDIQELNQSEVDNEKV